MAAALAAPIQKFRAITDAASDDTLDVCVENAFTDESGAQLEKVVEETSQKLQTENNKNLRQQAGSLTAAQLLQQMLAKGEERVSAAEFSLKYDNVKFYRLDHNDEPEKAPMHQLTLTNGELILTSRRFLFMSTGFDVSGSFDTVGAPVGGNVTYCDRLSNCLQAKDMKGCVRALQGKSKDGEKHMTMRMSVQTGERTSVYPLPLDAVRHFELKSETGITTTATVKRELNCCACLGNSCLPWACCCGFETCCISEKVDQTGKVDKSKDKAQRDLSFMILLPPWGRHYMMKVHFDHAVPTLAITQMLSALQQHATSLNVVKDAGTAPYHGGKGGDSSDSDDDSDDDSDGSDDSGSSSDDEKDDE